MPPDDAASNDGATPTAATPRRRRRWIWWLLAVIVVAAAAVAAIVLVSGSETETATAPTVELSFGEAIVTDLVQTESFDGTLGAVDGDPVTSQFTGTVTAAATAGEIVEQGDILYSIDGDPVVLLYGTAPAYRDLAMGVDTVTVGGRLAGTITEMAEPGTAIGQGDVLYRVNGEPVVVLYGDVPAYRTMRDAATNLEGDDVEQLEAALIALGYDPDGTVTVDLEFTYNTGQMVEAWQEDIGAETDGVVDLGEVVFIPGPAQVRTSASVGDSSGGAAPVATLITGESLTGGDVQQLETALSALGFDPGTIDDTFTDETRIAVLEWQSATGLEEDGVVDLGEILFLDGPVFVSEQLASSGSRVSPGNPVLAVSASEKVVRIDLPAREQGIVSVGDDVIIIMPDFSETPGVVASVATTASVDQGNQAVFEVIVELTDPSVAAGLDEAPVEVDVISDSVEGVLAVPVSSLVALSEGGYAVRVETGAGSPRLVAVDPGFFADGYVEVTGSELEAGDRVVVP